MNSCHVLPEMCVLVNACVSDGPVLDNLYVYVCVFACVHVCKARALHASLSCMLRFLTLSFDTRMTILHKHSMYGDFDFDGLIEVSGVTGFIYLGQLRLFFTLVSFTRNFPGIKAWGADWPIIH
jgi:hypothetical protein